jgi:phosphoribosylanthranilate isomerase
MKPLIKVCGIQNIEEARGAIAAGANTIGLLVGLTHPAQDKITPEAGKRIVESIPDTIRMVMVTHLLDAEKIAAIAKMMGVSAIQIHDDLPVEGILKLHKLLHDVELIKAIHVTGKEALDKAKRYAGQVDMLLLDSRTEKCLGGTGQTHDWNISRQIAQAVSVPVILAGGLNPENAALAIEKVRPAGIDANSGLEHPDGSKDFDKIKSFAKIGRKLLSA